MKSAFAKILSALCLSALYGCGTAPIKVSFPMPPANLTRDPIELRSLSLPAGAKLSDIEAQHEREAEAMHLNTEQLKGLINWVREQQHAHR